MDGMMVNRWRRQRRSALAFLYFAALCTGVLSGFVASGMEELHPGFTMRVHFLTAVLLSLGSMWFCTVDAKLAGRPLIQLAKLGIFLLWPVGVPIYVLSVRGIRGFGVLVLHAILLFLAYMSSGVATFLLLGWDEFFT